MEKARRVPQICPVGEEEGTPFGIVRARHTFGASQVARFLIGGHGLVILFHGFALSGTWAAAAQNDITDEKMAVVQQLFGGFRIGLPLVRSLRWLSLEFGLHETPRRFCLHERFGFVPEL